MSAESEGQSNRTQSDAVDLRPIPLLKKGGFRTLLNRLIANRVLWAVNAFMGMRAGRGLKMTWATSGPVIELIDAAPRGPGGGGAALTVREQDSSPSVSGVAEIRVPNGSLTDHTAGSVSIAFASLSVQDEDGTPNVSNVTNIKLPNSVVTDNAAGSVSLFSGFTVQWVYFKDHKNACAPMKMQILGTTPVADV